MELKRLVCGLGLPGNARQTRIPHRGRKEPKIRNGIGENIGYFPVVTTCLTEVNSRGKSPFGFTNGEGPGPSPWQRSGRWVLLGILCLKSGSAGVQPVALCKFTLRTPAHGIESTMFRMGHRSLVTACWIILETQKSVSIVILNPVTLTMRIDCHRHLVEDPS